MNKGQSSSVRHSEAQFRIPVPDTEYVSGKRFPGKNSYQQKNTKQKPGFNELGSLTIPPGQAKKPTQILERHQI